MNYKPAGIIPPVITPFTKEGAINRPVFRQLLNRLIDAGVHGIFVAGSQGEFYALEREERIQAFEIAVEEVNGRVPVYAGTAAITTAETVRLTQAAEAAGIDAVSIITPFFITPNSQEIYQHYKTVAESTRLPVLLYNNPDRTNVGLSVALIQQLAQIDNIVGIKDSSGDMTMVGEIIRNTGFDFHLLCGRDTMIYAALSYGGSGAVPASANVAPELAVSIYELFQKGDRQGALKAQYRLAPLRIAFGLGSFPVVIKEAMEIMGFDVGTTRAPIGPLTPEKRQTLLGILNELDLIA
ncbi:4-hydroxy-tetrahydrodipicolinate synthase [Hydrogenispora ethanolica]|jgi:4-hydroxy-tetrahydrodipicolinate synthase|uniref:4-hydroxy-tetrahydrodipicolinate synthase n=1 Tax=Hydrogenispora ethanolica TaxID=1082276 RepID=A0A4R1SBT6_HYDET|nr:4-hydroxy-tetrahydrodipicolinate synthase [Hydrogenispora ethanolica]TCL76981.1 4-hydroxy-tetrahydrodipicolinate synthase [Hydrogenispora ethanolica]